MFRIIITFSSILLFTFNCIAQPKDFYEQDFSKQPLKKGEISNKNNSRPTKDKKNASPKAIKKEEAKSKKTTNIMEPETNGTKIASIGLVVAGDDIKHIEKTFRSLKSTAVKNKLPLGEITIWGGIPEGIDKKLMAAIVIMGANLKVAFKPADTYSITQSPTWVLETKDGVVLLEGIDNVDRYINSKGEFVERR